MMNKSGKTASEDLIETPKDTNMMLMLIKACNSVSFYPLEKEKKINLSLVLEFHLSNKQNKSKSCR